MAGAGGVYTGGGATVVMDSPPVVYVKVFRSKSKPERHLRRKAEAVATLAKELAPKDSGALAASVAVDQNRNELGWFSFGFKVYASTRYVIYVHEGTGPSIRVKRPGAMFFMGTNEFEGIGVFTPVVKHPGTPANPFLEEALIAMAG